MMNHVRVATAAAFAEIQAHPATTANAKLDRWAFDSWVSAVPAPTLEASEVEPAFTLYLEILGTHRALVDLRKLA